MSAGQVAALVAAGAFVVLVILLAIPLIKLGRTLDEATTAIRAANERSDPLLSGANTTISHVNTQLERIDGVTADVRSASGNVSALTSVFTATLGGPLVKVAALSYGISRAIRRARRKSDGEKPARGARLGRRGRRTGGTR